MRRLYLTAREYEALLQKQDGKCCVDDREATDDLVGEHSTPNAWRPAKPDQLMCSRCHKVKTLRDIKAIWKVKRLSGVTPSQYQRRKWYGPRMKGRPFSQSSQARRGQSWTR
jgi:hypothetical protein